MDIYEGVIATEEFKVFIDWYCDNQLGVLVYKRKSGRIIPQNTSIINMKEILSVGDFCRWVSVQENFDDDVKESFYIPSRVKRAI